MRKKWVYGLLVWIAGLSNPVSAYAAESKVSGEVLQVGINSVFVFIAAMLVFFMQAGFALLEAGSLRMKNAGHIAGKMVRAGWA